MTLARMHGLLDDARTAGRGLAALNVMHLESAEAIIAGAELAGTAVVLQISQNCARYHGALEPIAAATIACAERAAVPAVVHLDHADDPELVREAIDLGFGSVMFDASALDYAQNVARTREIAELARASGVAIEAELGAIGGKGGAHDPGVRTDPGQAREFVLETGVDSLAVAVGSRHAMRERSAELDLELVSRLRDAVGVPLVLHGSSGVSDAGLAAAVRAGMTKVNLSTHLVSVFTREVRAVLSADLALVDSRRYLGAGRASMAAEVARLLELLSSPVSVRSD